MRILHVHSGNLYGGVETMLAAMASDTGRSSNMEAEYALCFPGRFQNQLSGLGLRVHDLGAARVRNPFSIARARRRLYRLLSRGRFNVVICQGAWALALFGSVIKRAKMPLVAWIHDPPVNRLHWLERWAQQNCPRLVICNSEYTRLLTRRLFPEVASKVLYCPVKAPSQRLGEAERIQMRADMGVRPSTSVILQVARLERHKGHLFHLEALAKLPRGLDWQLWCVGGIQKPSEQDYLDEIHQSVNAKGLSDRVKILDWQPNLQRLYQCADIYCQPNIRPEPFGIAFIEAMYSSLPVIGSKLGGAVEVISPDVGLVVEPGDSNALARLLSDLLSDSAKRVDFAANGPRRARILCDPTTQLNLFEDMLSPLMT